MTQPFYILYYDADRNGQLSDLERAHPVDAGASAVPDAITALVSQLNATTPVIVAVGEMRKAVFHELRRITGDAWLGGER